MARVAQQFSDIPFTDLTPGRVFRARLHLTDELVREYARLSGVRERSGDDTTVPASVYCTFLPMFHALGGRMEQGTVHVGQRTTVRRTVRVGTVLTAEVTVREATERGDRRTVVVETVFREADAIACVATSTYLWGYARR